ncbi:MAG: hypothetical protein BIFFINMI_04018 [Phycisphaerae bacterium]|nr:hypothetical protein [Phycisphaerae bacterium]
MTLIEFILRWLASLSLIVWLGSLVYLIIAAVILFRHAGGEAGDLIGHCLAAMSRLSYACMPPLVAWAAWTLVRNANWVAWARLAVLGATLAVALAAATWAIPSAARERQLRNAFRGQGPNPHAEPFEKLHARAVWLQSVVAGGLGLLSLVEALGVTR